MPATITTLYPAKISKRQTLADLCEPDRREDEALLRVMASFEDAGIAVITEDDPIPTGAKLILQPSELVAMAEQAAGPMGLGDLIARDSNVSPELRAMFAKWSV